MQNFGGQLSTVKGHQGTAVGNTMSLVFEVVGAKTVSASVLLVGEDEMGHGGKMPEFLCLQATISMSKASLSGLPNLLNGRKTMAERKINE